MFDWFWEFLYSISEILFEIIDGLMSIANMLCGIEPITVSTGKTDFLTYLLNHDKVMYGFIGAGLIGIFLIMVFSIFAMIKSIKGKSEITPGRVAINVMKTLGIFLVVPFVMVAFTTLVNELMIILYKATSLGADTMGDFLFKAFLPEGIDTSIDAFVNFRNVDQVDAYMSLNGYDLSDYRFFFSWLCCIPLLFALAKGLLNFVDRTISIVLLFIVSPISISSSIVDDGAHFKLWREQILIKYLTGYGIIVGLNIYILIVSIICGSSIVFFDSSFLNFLFKVAFILGGAVSLERTMALVGNLVSQGAGSNELRDAAIAYNDVKGYAKEAGGFIKDKGKELYSKLTSGGGGGGGQDPSKQGAQSRGGISLTSGGGYSQEAYNGKGNNSSESKIYSAIVGSETEKDKNENDSKKEEPNEFSLFNEENQRYLNKGDNKNDSVLSAIMSNDTDLDKKGE